MREIKPLIYIAGPYSDLKLKVIMKNIDKARKVAIICWNKGGVAVTPHTNHGLFETYEECEIGYEDFMDGCISLLSVCNAIFLLDEWELSPGAKEEHIYAIEHKIPVLNTIDELEQYIKEFNEKHKWT